MIRTLAPIFFVIGKIIKKFNLLVNQGGFKIKFPDFMTATELGCSIVGTYEKNERKLVKKHLKESDYVLELGACIGVVSLTINEILSDKTKQVSVEPNPQMYPYLVQNKKRNNGEFNIETCIVTTNEEVTFYLGGEAFLGSNSFKGENKITVKGKTLEELTKNYFEFTALIMDIEGGELDFFRSFDLSLTKIRLIVMETHQQPDKLNKEEFDECHTLLKKYGFTLFDASENVEAWHRDVL